MSSTNGLSPDTVNFQLRHWSHTDPDRPAFVFLSADPRLPRMTLTRCDVTTLACRYAACLRRSGVQKGDVVCNTLPNSPERLITDMGIIAAGAVAMNGVIMLADGSDFVGCLQESKCVALVTDRDPEALPGKFVLDSEDGDVVSCESAPDLKLLLKIELGVSEDGRKVFLDRLRKGFDGGRKENTREGGERSGSEDRRKDEDKGRESETANANSKAKAPKDTEEYDKEGNPDKREYLAAVSPSDYAVIWTTSGSTGFCKMAPRTHASFLACGHGLAVYMQDTDVYHNDRPLGWIGGSPGVFCSKGVTRVLTDRTLQGPEDAVGFLWEAMVQEGCTVSLILPSHLPALQARPQLWEGRPRPRTIITGGQPPSRQHLQAGCHLCDEILVAYAMTEAGVVSVRRVGLRDCVLYEKGDNGPPCEGNQVEIVDEDGQVVREAGRQGEVLLKGPAVFKGYLGSSATDGQPNAVFTPDGWFRTGDVGFFSTDGHLHLVCRKANAITHGAVIIYPGWLENCMEKCPGVQSLYLVPVPDAAKGQELCACLTTETGVKVTEEEVKTFCQNLFLVSEKSDLSAVPKYFVFFDQFPCKATGKPDRKALRTAALARLGIEDNCP